MKITKKNIRALGFDWSRTSVFVAPNPAMRQWYINFHVGKGDFRGVYTAMSLRSMRLVRDKLKKWRTEFAEEGKG